MDRLISRIMGSLLGWLYGYPCGFAVWVDVWIAVLAKKTKKYIFGQKIDFLCTKMAIFDDFWLKKMSFFNENIEKMDTVLNSLGKLFSTFGLFFVITYQLAS
jgi:hypothetical protein